MTGTRTLRYGNQVAVGCLYLSPIPKPIYTVAMTSNLSGWVNWTHTFLYNTLDAQLLCNNNGSLLSDDQRSRVRIRANVARADGQIGNFESTNAIHVQV